MEQRSFERGLLIGFNAVIAMLRDRASYNDIVRERDDLLRAIEQRDNPPAGVARAMCSYDIYAVVPLAHPSDFGLGTSELEDEQVRLSRLRPAQGTSAGTAKTA